MTRESADPTVDCRSVFKAQSHAKIIHMSRCLFNRMKEETLNSVVHWQVIAGNILQPPICSGLLGALQLLLRVSVIVPMKIIKNFSQGWG